MTNKARLMSQIKDLIDLETSLQTNLPVVTQAVDEHVSDYHRGDNTLKQLVVLLRGELEVAENHAIQSVRQRLNLY